MKTNKSIQIAKSLVLGLLIMGSTFFTACTDECKEVVCENKGTCDEGICDCPEGTKGENCETFVMAKTTLVGTWELTDIEEDGVKTPGGGGLAFIFESCSAEPCNVTFKVTENSSSGDYQRIQEITLTYKVKDAETLATTRVNAKTTITENGDTKVENEACTGNCTDDLVLKAFDGTTFQMHTSDNKIYHFKKK